MSNKPELNLMQSAQQFNHDTVLSDTRTWLERAVIGLNLCPFAKGVYVKGQIHFAVSAAIQAQDLLEDLKNELNDLAKIDSMERDTTLLIAPEFMSDFLDFNDFLPQLDKALRACKLDGIIQIAPFHPQFQFAGTDVDDITNYTNRAPYPTLHLIREASIDRAVLAYPEAETIFEANMQTLKKMGHSGWQALGVGSTNPSKNPTQ